MSALLLALALGADAASWKAGGSLKDVWQLSESSLDRRPYALNLFRARLSLDAEHSALKAHVDYDHEAFAGGYFRTQEAATAGLGSEPFLPMQKTIEKNATAVWRHRLYRAWLGLEAEPVVARFGRQRIAWGSGKLWNPTDVLNPQAPTAVERDERLGVDAAYARAALGELSQAEAAYALEERWPQQALLGRWKGNLRAWDVSLMGGKAAGSTAAWVAGGDLAGEVADGTLHAEWSYTDPELRLPFWRLSIGYDYSFTAGPLKDASVVLEYYHNGAGTTNALRYDPRLLLSGREVSLGKDYLGATYSQDLHPLVKLDLVLIANLGDGSHFVWPSVQFNPWRDLWLTAGLQRLGGGRLSEYGRNANRAILQAQFFF